MSKTRLDGLVIMACLVAWIAVFVASAHGALGVSGKVSDGILAVLAVIAAHRLWRIYRR